MRLIQLSDCHLLADPEAAYKGWKNYQMLHELLCQIQQQDRADAILLSGDLNQDETEETYHLLGRTLRQFFDQPIYALPGNHDRPELMPTILGEYGVQCQMKNTLGAWQLLMLNSHQPGEASGFVSQAELDTISALLAKTEDTPTLVAVHHHPHPIDCTWMDRIMLQNGPAVLQTLAPHQQVKALAFGHVHQAFEQSWQHIKLLGTPSSCRQFKPGAREFALDDKTQGYRWIELEDEGVFRTGITRLGEH